MVVVGNFSVRLVEAKTKEAFKEHKGPKGDTYCEVEPDLDYFIETAIVGGDHDKVYKVTFSVDGKQLNLRLTKRPGGRHTAGLGSIEDGVAIQRALSFKIPSVSGGSSATDDLIGNVRVDFWEASFHSVISERQNFDSCTIDPASISANLSHKQSKKVLRSGMGTHTESKELGPVYNRFRAVRLLESITVNYCTALGLIHAGVLQKPSDFWEEARMILPKKRGTANSNAVDIKPKRIKKETTIGGSGVAALSTEHDLFDLSSLPDSDEED